MVVKRVFDIIVSCIGLIIFSPIFVWLGITIIREDQGPVFYRAPRVGKDRNQFLIYKFRSMVINADKVGGPTTRSEDPRVTKIGQVIRKYKLDELAQLINVFFGQMSLVGPRPEIPSEVETYDPSCDIIFTVRPGITDFSSIEFRDEGGIIERSGIADSHEAYRQLIQPKKLELQKKYVRDRSFILDIKLIFQTILAIAK
jgi:lipopolysaccharide/colanic/teichoic acid biosynthesis glycosyltransferase